MANTKTISIRVVSSGNNQGPFDILTIQDVMLRAGVTKEELVEGISLEIDEAATSVKIKSTGSCEFEIIFPLEDITNEEWVDTPYVENGTGCITMLI